MAKPVKKTERNLFDEIDLKIMLIGEQIKNHQQSIEKAMKMGGLNGPSGISGIDYSREPTKSVHLSFDEVLPMIQLDYERIKKLKKERTELKKSKKRIEKIYKSLDGVESKVYYLRIICKMTQEAAADEMGFSCRHFQRIEYGMRERGLL
ncbi:MAG: hypothetical protein HFG80_10630 [Eubacterium sp.]|nr:hypothetical protein [Eubacterium sp.]